MMPPHLRRARLRGLYVITDERWGGGHLAIARAALRGGASVVQLRAKNTPLPKLLSVAQELRRLTREHGALFLINDRIDVALLCQSDGVHLGPDDCPVALARRALGPHILIGASCGDAEESRQAELDGADYIGAGDIFGTATKPDAGAPIGLEGLQRIAQSTQLPVAAIGGLSRDTIHAAIEHGAAMACAISAVAKAGDDTAMQQAARELIAAARFPAAP
ncbi:MAG: thiamine-phosphate pyrophosphorylase [Abditibacteriota bacterium]|nr:thiamine-phosphate pyrophosphorylase [Abditibacteriota bacterium]